MNRRAFLSVASLTPLILIPEVPDVRRVYSFMWERETEHERMMRLARESVRTALDRFVGKRLSYDPLSVAASIEQAVLAGGGDILWGPRVTVEADAFFLESKTMRVRVEWRQVYPLS